MDHTVQRQLGERPVLIFDKEGVFGIPFATLLAKERLTVLVSKHIPEKAEQLIVVPYKKQIPKIPNSAFSQFFIIYNGEKRMLDLLPAFVKKAKADGTHIFFLIPVRAVERSLLDTLLAMPSFVTVAIVGDIFGAEWSIHNPVTQLLWQAQQGSVVLPDMGLLPLYPVHGDDFLFILRSLTEQKTMHGIRTLYLLPPHPVSMLSFSRILAKLEPDLKIDFSTSKSTSRQSYHPSGYASVFGPTYDYSHKIPALSLSPFPEPLAAPAAKPKHIALPKIGLVPWLLIGLALITPILLPVVSAAVGAGLLAHAHSLFRENQLVKAHASAVAARQFFSVARQTQRGVTAPLAFVHLSHQEQSVTHAFQSGEDIANLLIGGIDGVHHLEMVFSGKSLEPKREFSQGINDLKYAFTTFSTMQAEGRIPGQFTAITQDVTKAGAVFMNTFDVLPEFLGMNGKRMYLVLLQNNMELRPGGGFIGSYGILTVMNGRIEDFTVQDVYDADGQLKDHVEPPFQLKRYLVAAHWFLRDSNFDIDFSKSAAMAAYFYNLEMGKKVDGVIAVDVSFAKNLLKATGPLKVPGFNEIITADNFFLLTETYAQDKFFPGSTQKKDFLSAVYTTVMLRVTEGKNLPYGPLASALAESIRQKHLLITFPEKSMQNVFAVAGLSSTLLDESSGREGVFNDFLGINEANIGANKSNYYLDRAIHHHLSLEEPGSAVGNVKIEYHNRSKPETAFGGDYKNYLRVIVPSGAQLLNVTLDGYEQETLPAITDPNVFSSKAFTPPQALEVERSEENGKTVFGFLVNVPAGKKKTVGIAYTVPTNITPTTPQVTYSLKIFKQPGTNADPYVFSLALPQNTVVLDGPKNLREQGREVKFLTDTAEDREMKIVLTKK